MRSLAYKAWDFLPFVKGRKRPSREDLLRAMPVRNDGLRWFKEDGEVNLRIPRKRGRFGDLAGRIFRLPDEKVVVLDKVGSGVWELCDGFHSVERILEHVMRRHKLSRREAEVSVSAYLKILAERRLIGIRQAESKRSRDARARHTDT